MLVRRARIGQWGWSIAVAAIIALGGGNWTMPTSRLAAELVSVLVLVCAVWSSESRFPTKLATEDKFLLAIFGLIILHIIPLPPFLWTQLPGRSLGRETDIAVFGRILWRPLSLDPFVTLRAAVSLLPATAIYVAVRTSSRSRLTAILRGLVLALGIAMAASMAQLLFPDASLLHFYPRGDYEFPIGFFTNHNHQAIFLVCAVPMAAGWLALSSAPSYLPADGNTATRVLATTAVPVVMMVLVSGSRAGTALLPVGLCMTAFAWARRNRRAPLVVTRAHLLLLACVAGLGAMIVGMGGELLLRTLNRAPIGNDMRWEFWPDVSRTITAFWPAGSGIGTFVEAFAMHEPLSSVSPRYLNHAHDEFLETGLEAGVPGLVLGVGFIWRVAERALQAWLAPTGSEENVLWRLATIPPVIIILHSLVDYPARTFAISSMLAACWAMFTFPHDAADGPENPTSD